jgi:ATP/maltotriose-dependent transcriptional regulator MalT
VLTADPARRTERALAAAQASLQAGAFGQVLELLVMAEAGPLDELQADRADLLRGQATFVSGLGSDAPPLLFKAARRLEPLDLGLARETYLSAWMAALFAGRLAGAGDLPEVSRAARAWGWYAQAAASALWDDDAWRAMLVRQVRLAHDAGALDQLPIMLDALGTAAAWSGDFAAAASLIAEADAVCAATGSRAAPFAAIMLASLRGDQAEAAPLIEATIAQATTGGQGIAVAYVHWVAAILANGLARYAEALAAARHAYEDTFTLHVSIWALPELVEAAARTGNTHVAPGALERLAETTQAGGTDFGLGLEARCRALLSGGAAADELYREAIDRLGRTRLRPELARAHLLYGEWLRREGRRVDARGQLRTAHDMFAAIGMAAFAGRARRELIATGEKVPKRGVEARDRLTPQEEQIARLARDGRTSPEIGAQLFLSARTVEWHLGKVFTKLARGSPPRTARRAGPARTRRPGGLAESLNDRWPARPVPSSPFTREQQRTPRPQDVSPAGRVRSRGRRRGP